MDSPEPPVALSVIIPVFREEARMAALLAHLAELPAPGGAEFLVVDGDPGQRTLAAIPRGAARPEGAAPPVLVRLASGQGRARQMNAGASIARADVLLFLHADTRLPGDAFALIHAALADEQICGGAFGLGFGLAGEPVGPGLRCIAWAANLRARLFRAPYGDQAIFLRRDCFEALGGFPDLPLMEDLELMTRLRRAGRKIRLLDARVRTSARRWEREGLLRCTGRNVLLRTLYHLGVGAARLARFYP